MGSIRFEGKHLFKDDHELKGYSSGYWYEAHHYDIIMAVMSPNERFVLSLDKEGLLKLWKHNDQKWSSRAPKEYKVEDVRAIAVPDSQTAVLVATEHTVHCFRMADGWHGDYGSAVLMCSFPISLSITHLQCTADGITATDADKKTEVIHVKF